MKTGFSTLLNFLRSVRLNWAGCRVGGSLCLSEGIVARLGWNGTKRGTIEVGESCRIETGVELNAWGGSIHVGKHVFIGPYSVIYGHGGVSIGDHALISMHCRILSSEHALAPRARIIRSEPDTLLPTRIGEDVWLGAGVSILGGTTIGKGAVVGAGAVVTRDVPEYAVVAGVPAKVVRFRTQEDA